MRAMLVYHRQTLIAKKAFFDGVLSRVILRKLVPNATLSFPSVYHLRIMFYIRQASSSALCKC